MIDVLFEQKIVQNTGLAAEAIWQAAHDTFEAQGRSVGITFPLVFLVLPLVFHQRTALILASKTQPGALYKALSEDRELTVGLQERMQAMSNRTLQALSIGFQTGLLLLNPTQQLELVPGRATPPVVHVTDEVKVILNAAKRVGQSFAEMSVAQLSTHLNIRF